MERIPGSFFTQADTVGLAKWLLGKHLVSDIGPSRTCGRIVETEAYLGEEDRACHAYNGRRTKRTETMFQEGGIIYVYLCYGIHHLLNIVTHAADAPHAILIRALEPLEGVEVMLERRGKSEITRSLLGGPGALTQALGITTARNGSHLDQGPVWLRGKHLPPVPQEEIIASPRVGVAYAKEHAQWPLRFRIASSKWTSPAK